ncbi:MAG: hypothetical protein CAPSK01_001967 [Candidatus Accumulibacter vicinus]|uniref:Uncharacterized protein n=1 Tax=Candidatus Accumulibacter vicinus TaxID=2954382 RepID=A0A084Y1H7_9PROT|nr:MAG: hypothetical protein CAPSK01_001967 [Candidatus Accumulibacter vicinus]
MVALVFAHQGDNFLPCRPPVVQALFQSFNQALVAEEALLENLDAFVGFLFAGIHGRYGFVEVGGRLGQCHILHAAVHANDFAVNARDRIGHGKRAAVELLQQITDMSDAVQ